MNTAELTRCMTPADQGIVAVCVDDVAHLGDDDAASELHKALYFNLDLDWSAAERLAYAIIHDCKRN